MKFKDIKFTPTTTPKGVQALLEFGDYELSVICNESSYGGKNNGSLYEIGVFKDSKMIELPGITEQGDTVKGFLTESDVETIILKMKTITEPLEWN